MKFIAGKKNLFKSLNIISKAVSTRTSMPILSGILIEADDNGFLKITSSNVEMTIENKIETEVIEAGRTVVPAKLFEDIIRKLPEGDIIVETINNHINIKCQSSDFDIMTMPAEEFPSITNSIIEQERISLDSKTLSNMIRETSFAASQDLSKPVLTGILINLKKDSLRLVAIDGFRIAISEKPHISEKEASVIIKADIMNEISKIILENNVEGNIDVILEARSAAFIIENTKIFVKIFEGNFISYEGLIPKSNDINIVLRKKDLQDAIERASLVSRSGKHNLIKLQIKDKIVEVSSNSEEGKVEENLIADKTGPDIEIGFNAKYILDVLKVIEDDEIKLSLKDSTSFGMIENEKIKGYKYILCPVRLSSNV